MTEDSPREPLPGRGEHLLARWAPGLPALAEELARSLEPRVFEQALADVPDSLLLTPLAGHVGLGDPYRLRQAYQAFLWKRLRASSPFETDAPFAPSSRRA